MPDSLTDLEVGGSDIVYTDTNDLGTVSGFDTVVQSAALGVGEETKLLIGGDISPRTVRKLRQNVASALNSDPQLATVVSVEITDISKSTNTVELRAKTVENEDFSLDLVV